MAVAWAANGDPRGAGGGPDVSPGSSGLSGDHQSGGLDSEARVEDESVRSRGAALATAADGTGLMPAHVALKPVALIGPGDAAETPIVRAIRSIEECQARYEAINDYVCTFSKRERVDGRMTSLHVMSMKVRTRPRSIYLKFRQPVPGREAIYIDGGNDGKVLAHDVGLGRLIAGTLRLDPTGERAMEDCRHPITDAGIGPLLDTIEARWSTELDPSESLVAFRDGQLVGSRPCTLIETTHPRHQPEFLFHQVRVYIDQELGLPIRFEAYDWPTSPQSPPELVEEYTYTELELNVGLRDVDFDISNADYAFGRF
jgi:hypothetical protein